MKNQWDSFNKLDKFYDVDSLRLIRKFIIENAISVFEGACGNGYLIYSLRKDGYKGKYLGSDFSDGMLKNSKENNPDEDFVEIDLTQKINLSDNSFDVTVVDDGIYYILDYQPVIEELKRITKKYIILTYESDFYDGKDDFVIPGGTSYKYNKDKFYNFVDNIGLKIIKHSLMNEVDTNNLKTYQKVIVILEKI